MQANAFARINAKALSLTGSGLWGLLVLLVALGNVGLPSYGQAFLDVAASIYPGYRAEPTLPQILLVTFYAAIDGAIAGFAVGWIYNRLAGSAT